MTNEFAIECIKDFKKSFGIYTYDADIKELIVALDMAIKALEQQPSEDCISREDAIKEFQSYREYDSNRTNNELVDRIEDVLKLLPPVMPQRPKGKWIARGVGFTPYECSECEAVEFKKSNYCPKCGAEMSGGEEE